MYVVSHVIWPAVLQGKKIYIGHLRENLKKKKVIAFQPETALHIGIES